MPLEQICAVRNKLKALRFMDEMLYLRSGELNIFTGMVGLTFSWDGFHYTPYEEFLKTDHPFWVGS
jgi:hypothetical protein